MLTGGQVADCTAGEALLERLPDCDILHADKGYDANAISQQVERRGTMPNIPPKANRKWKNCFSPFLYRNRNAIERMFCRLKAPTRRDPLRPQCRELPRRSLHRGRRQLLVMSLDPRLDLCSEVAEPVGRSPVGQSYQSPALTMPSAPQACAMSPRPRRALPPPPAIGCRYRKSVRL